MFIIILLELIMELSFSWSLVFHLDCQWLYDSSYALVLDSWLQMNYPEGKTYLPLFIRVLWHEQKIVVYWFIIYWIVFGQHLGFNFVFQMMLVN